VVAVVVVVVVVVAAVVVVERDFSEPLVHFNKLYGVTA
jgi:hypothetical protein